MLTGEARATWTRAKAAIDQMGGRTPPEGPIDYDDLRHAWRVLNRHLGPLQLIERVPNGEMTRREGERRRREYRGRRRRRKGAA